MQAMTTPPPTALRHRRLGTTSHAAFVGTLVPEMLASLTWLRAAVADWQAQQISRFVRLIDAVDGEGTDRRLQAVHLPTVVMNAARAVGIEVRRTGGATQEYFVANAERVQLGMEFLLLAAAGAGDPVEVRVPTAYSIAIEGAGDLTAPRAGWHLRSGRHVLETQGCRLRRLPGHASTRLEVRGPERLGR